MTYRGFGFSVALIVGAFSCGSPSESGGSPPAVAGAAGESPRTACGSFVPCGGDLHGTWEIADLCATEQGKATLWDLYSFCDALPTTLEANASGTFEFDSSGQVKKKQAFKVEMTASVPSRCVANGVTCGDVESVLLSRRGIVSASCDVTGGECDCKQSALISLNQETSYQVNGSSYSETDLTDGSSSSLTFCVTGDSLRIGDADANLVLRRVKP